MPPQTLSASRLALLGNGAESRSIVSTSNQLPGGSAQDHPASETVESSPMVQQSDLVAPEQLETLQPESKIDPARADSELSHAMSTDPKHH